MAPQRLSQSQADQHDDDDRHGEDEERRAPGRERGQAGAEEHADDGADADAGAMGRIHPGPRLDRVVVGQERVVRREDHGLSHGDPGQHHGGHHRCRCRAERDGEGGTDQRADEGDGHASHPVGQDGDGEGARQRGRTGDGHDEQDPRVGEVEGVADVGREDVEGALGGLVEQLDAEEDGEREQGHPTPQPLTRRRHAAGTGPVVAGSGPTACRRAMAATAPSRRS